MQNFIVREDGQALGEYALILALIAVVCVAAATALGGAVASKLNTISTTLNAAGTSVA